MALNHNNNKALQIARLFLWGIFFFLISCKKEKNSAIEWTKVSCNQTEAIRSLCCINNSDTLFICGGKRESNGFVMRSTNAGDSWQTVLQSQSISFNKIYFKNSKVGFALGDFLDIYKTKDGGINWEHCVFSGQVDFNYKVVMRELTFITDSIAFALGGDDFGNGIILKSCDEGQHWNVVQTEDHELRSLYFSSNGIAFSSGYGILLKSMDAGVSWNATSLSDDFFTALKFTDPLTAYLTGYNGNLYKSIDGGDTWKKIVKENTFLSSKRIHFTSLDFWGLEYGIAAGEDGYIQFTSDGGNSWKRAQNPENAGIHEIQLSSERLGWACCDNGILYHFEIPEF